MKLVLADSRIENFGLNGSSSFVGVTQILIVIGLVSSGVLTILQPLLT